MKVYTEYFPTINEPFAVCIGKFDGLHIGHRLILDTLLDEARTQAASSLIYSFEPHNGTPLLTSRAEKLELFQSLGIDGVIVAEFTDELMAMTAEEFIQRLADCGRLKAVVVGADFRFGRGAAGDVALLYKLGILYGFTVHAIGQVEVGGQPVSSTLIRQTIREGDAEKAAGLLGREYALSGEVIHGRQLGRKLGFRTVNISLPKGKVVPAYGVYACRVGADGETWPAMTNIGVKPTLDGAEPVVESHLFGFDGDLYGKTITVRLVKKIRDEVRFESLEHLQQQLEKDKLQVLETMK
jgi:riboflavin kinase / FMN adenylyltransferase